MHLNAQERSISVIKKHYSICCLCGAACGIEIQHKDGNLVSIRGDKANRHSRGFICPKAVALKDIHNDPDRLRHPVIRKGDKWEEISWKDAYEYTGQKIRQVQKTYGNDSVGVYIGNAMEHNYDSVLPLLTFVNGFKTRNRYSAISVDSLARLAASLLLYNNQAILPTPDIERTDIFLIIGANPLVSNGSIMTAPDTKKRFKEIQKRGGKIIVIDPRRTETAAAADAHYFIKPGTDALLLFAMIDTLFKEKQIDTSRLRPFVDGIEKLKQYAAGYSPEIVSPVVGIAPEEIRNIAREFGTAKHAVCYGRLGVSTQEFGTLSTWLIDILNIITDNMDTPGGAMFNTPAVDLPGLANLFRLPGTFNQYQSRVSGLPEFNGELPVAALAEEMETPGSGQIKALFTAGGNPLLSLPNTKRLQKTFENLEFMASIDYYINETTKFANIIFPPTSFFERDRYPVIELMTGVHNFAQYSPAVFPKSDNAKHLWEIMVDLSYYMDKHRGYLSKIMGWIKWVAVKNVVTPKFQLDCLLRLGPQKLSIRKLLGHPHGLLIGPLQPRLKSIINTKNKRINLFSSPVIKDLERLSLKLKQTPSNGNGKFLLISRRTLRSMNTWMHNSPRLVGGPHRCTLMIHPEDAKQKGLSPDQRVVVKSRVGSITVQIKITDEVMPGVVSLPFGWGHNQSKTKLSIANQHAGANMNDIVDDEFYDQLSGSSALGGIPVDITSVG